ncbi:MAG: hypothetical protein NC112_00985 [Oxalobacter formigenes]|nr:hypothetical protein [Oxalobacter formigenes]
MFIFKQEINMLFRMEENVFVGDDSTVREVHGLDSGDMQRIRDYLQGAVYCWCNINKQEWFAARHFIGGENFCWEGCPLEALFIFHRNAGKSDEEAFEQAGKDAGHILKSVLEADQRHFETKKEYVRRYRWLGE